MCMGKPVDEVWFKEVKDICCKTEEVEWLQKNMQALNEEKEQFFSNEIENPLLTYRKPVYAAELVATTEALIKRLTHEEHNEDVLDLYRRKLENQISRISLAVASGDGKDSDFYQASCKLYGKPAKKYFAYVAHQTVAMFKRVHDKELFAGKALYKTLSKIDGATLNISADILPPVVKKSRKVTSVDEAVAVFQETLDKLSITDWTIVVDTQSNRSRFSISAHSKKIFIPNQKQLDSRSKKMTMIQLQGLAEHEIGVHANRSHHGFHSNLQLLSIGLDSYMRGEEGVASYVQQQVEGANEFYGLDRYLAASLAVGMDGTKRDFRAVYELMFEYYQLHYADIGYDASFEQLQQASWEVCVRIFRGTTGQTPGCIYTKDIVYLEGNVSIWHLLSDKPHAFPDFFVGKYNPLLKRHVRALRNLGIIQEDW